MAGKSKLEMDIDAIFPDIVLSNSQFLDTPLCLKGLLGIKIPSKNVFGIINLYSNHGYVCLIILIFVSEHPWII